MPDITSASLTPQAIVRFCELLQTRERPVGSNAVARGVKDSTIAAYHDKLYTFFAWLKANGHISQNPLDAVPRVRPKYEIPKMLRKPDIDQIRAAVDNHSSNPLQKKRDRAIVSVLLFCGVRRAELLGLQVMDFDPERMLLAVRAGPSKSQRARQMPLNYQTFLHLQDYLKERNNCRRYTTPSLFVALNRNRGLSSDGLDHWVERLRSLSGVRFHPHQFRHTFAANLAAKGMNSIQLQKLMGHSDLRLLQTYVRSLNVEDLRPGVSALTFENLV
jgi:site-specific recombinase XerD